MSHCLLFADHEPLLVYAKFMHAYHCYDLIPTSSKIVVLDTRLNVSGSFFSIVCLALPLSSWFNENNSR